MNRQMKHYYHKRALAIAYLGGKCAVCKTTENLEFDHIDTALKELDISSLLRGRSILYKAELDKCQLLCHAHHLEKHSRLEQHGLTAYNHCKCRCDVCISAKSTYNKLYKQKRKLLKTINSAERVPSLQVGSPRFDS